MNHLNQIYYFSKFFPFSIFSSSSVSDVIKFTMQYACMLSCVWLFVTLWTVAHQASLSIGFSRQEHWSEFPLLSPKDLPDPQIEHASPVSPALADRFFTHWAIGKPIEFTAICFKCLNLLYFWHTLIDFLKLWFLKNLYSLCPYWNICKSTH